MKKMERLKRLYNQLKDYLPIISIVLSISLWSISSLKSQHKLLLDESYRYADSKSQEIVLKGGKAYPIRGPDKWLVNVQQESGVQTTAQISSTITFLKGNTTILVLTSD